MSSIVKLPSIEEHKRIIPNLLQSLLRIFLYIVLTIFTGIITTSLFLLHLDKLYFYKFIFASFFVSFLLICLFFYLFRKNLKDKHLEEAECVYVLLGLLGLLAALGIDREMFNSRLSQLESQLYRYDLLEPVFKQGYKQYCVTAKQDDNSNTEGFSNTLLCELIKQGHTTWRQSYSKDKWQNYLNTWIEKFSLSQIPKDVSQSKKGRRKSRFGLPEQADIILYITYTKILQEEDLLYAAEEERWWAELDNYQFSLSLLGMIMFGIAGAAKLAITVTKIARRG